MDESARFKIIRVLIIGIVLVGAGFFFARLFLENQQKSKAGEAFANVTMSTSLDAMSKASGQTVTPGQIVDVSIAINQSGGVGVSGIDLALNNPGLSFVDPKLAPGYTIDVNGVFSETVLLSQAKDTTGRNTLSRLVMVAKKPNTLLSKGLMIKLRYVVVANNSTGDFIPVVRVVLNPAASLISGPNINNNLYTINPSTNIMVNFMYDGVGPTVKPITCNPPCLPGSQCIIPVISTCPPGASCAQVIPVPICKPITTPFPTICHPLRVSCAIMCGQPQQCMSDGCGGQSCCPATTPCAPSAIAPTNIGPTPTNIPIGNLQGAGLIFKVLMPDIAQTVAYISQVRLQVIDSTGNTPVDKIIGLQRIAGTNYFKTTTTLDLNLQDSKLYTVNVKGLKTLRRSFTGVRLTFHKIIDCSGTIATSDCGQLGGSIDTNELWSGDSDGFNDGTNGTSKSDSYNKVDAVDLQRLIMGYGSAAGVEPNGDYNLDGQINVLDLGILGRNLYKSGE